MEDAVREKARSLGFELCRITHAELPAEVSERLDSSIKAGHHATMEWLASTFERRKSPRSMWSEAKSAILLGLNYGPESDPMANLERPAKATISVYARNRDYHDVIKGRLKTLAGWFASRTGEEVKVFVDTAPLLEKPLAEQAGLGWQGKHTNLVSRDFGSWLFLGAILTTAPLRSDETETDHCGSCRACLDICPTNAFPAPYQLDARRCISYLTIEHAGPIPHEFRALMGNRIYGCDDCLAVCPWNKYAKDGHEAKLKARDDLEAPNLADLLALDDAAFRQKFSGSPIKRIKRNRFIRNVLVAAGNSGLPELRESVRSHLADPDPIVRGSAVWAMSKLESASRFADMKQTALEHETDPLVLDEWNSAV